MAEDKGLRFALSLDGQGSGRPLDWSTLANWTAESGTLWVHLNREQEQVHRWLRGQSGLSRHACDALLAEETRPRCTALPGGLLLILRGINLTPGAAPEDMISLRVWAEPHRLISVRLRHVDAVTAMREEIEAGTGARTTGEIISGLCRHLIEGIGPVIAELEDQVDEIEEAVVESADAETRDRLAAVRRQVILLRRYIAPQREALARLGTEPAAPLEESDRVALRETTDRISRHVEALDAVRERAALIHDHISAQLADQMTRGMYILSIVAAIFLPLSLLTGLLGINVGGIPGAEHPLGFALVALVLVVLIAAEVALLRWLRFL